MMAERTGSLFDELRHQGGRPQTYDEAEDFGAQLEDVHLREHLPPSAAAEQAAGAKESRPRGPGTPPGSDEEGGRTRYTRLAVLTGPKNTGKKSILAAVERIYDEAHQQHTGIKLVVIHQSQYENRRTRELNGADLIKAVNETIQTHNTEMSPALILVVGDAVLSPWCDVAGAPAAVPPPPVDNVFYVAAPFAPLRRLSVYIKPGDWKPARTDDARFEEEWKKMSQYARTCVSSVAANAIMTVLHFPMDHDAKQASNAASDAARAIIVETGLAEALQMDNAATEEYLRGLREGAKRARTLGKGSLTPDADPHLDEQDAEAAAPLARDEPQEELPSRIPEQEGPAVPARGPVELFNMSPTEAHNVVFPPHAPAAPSSESSSTTKNMWRNIRANAGYYDAPEKTPTTQEGLERELRLKNKAHGAPGESTLRRRINRYLFG